MAENDAFLALGAPTASGNATQSRATAARAAAMRPLYAKLFAAVSLCLIMAGAQLYGGLRYSSNALFSEALHMAFDSLSYVVSLVALRLGSRAATSRHSYGFDRIETLGALTNIYVIWAGTVPLLIDAVGRLAHPDEHKPPDGRMVMFYGAAGMLVNMLLAKWFWNDSQSHSHGNMSARAAKLHVAGDLLESFSVILAGGIVWAWPSLAWVDPLIAFLFALIVVATTVVLMKDVYYILMEATPKSIKSKELVQDLLQIEGVHCVHCMHVWQLAPGKICMTAHIHVHKGVDNEGVLRDAHTFCKYKYGLVHTTIQIANDVHIA